MSNRNSPFTIIARLFGLFFGILLAFSLLFNWAAGRYILQIHVVLIVSVVLTIGYVIVGWAFVTGGAEILMGRDPEYQQARARGWHPFWDELAVSDWEKPKDISGFDCENNVPFSEEFIQSVDPNAGKTTSDFVRKMSQAAKSSQWHCADFVPPSHWQYSCPKCNSRVEHAIDVCWACGYGSSQYGATE